MPAKSSFLIHLFLVVALVSVTHSVNNHVRDHDDTHFFSFSPSPPIGLFSCFVFVLFLFFSFLKPLESNEVFVAGLLRALVRVTMNVDSRQNKKARNFMFFCSYIIQFLLSFSKTIRRRYRMNEARFSSIHFFIIMTIYLFHGEELYDCLNFAGVCGTPRLLINLCKACLNQCFYRQ